LPEGAYHLPEGLGKVSQLARRYGPDRDIAVDPGTMFGSRNREPHALFATFPQEHGDCRYGERGESAEEEERIKEGNHIYLDSGTQLLQRYTHMD